MMRIIQSSPAPQWTPGVLARLFRHAKISENVFGDLQAELEPLFAAALREAELFAGLALITQTVRLELDEWPSVPALALPVGPVQPQGPLAVTVDGIAFAAVRLSEGLRPALVATAQVPPGEVVVTYQAGFGDTLDALPADVLMAICDQALVAYEARGRIGLSARDRPPMSAMFSRVLSRYRRVAI